MFQRMLLLALLLLLIAAPVDARRGPRLEVRIESLPGTVRAGETAVISWDELPSDVEELELLLSLDDGRRFTMTISPELEGRTRSYRWRIPAELAAERARLMIRAGGARGEREGMPSAAFRIAPPAAEPDSEREGVLWVTFGRDAVPDASDFGAAGTKLSTASAEPAISGAPGAPALQTVRGARRAELAFSATNLPAPARTAHAAPARRTPLRN